MSYPFRNLIFEGGGVKGIAYVGAMSVLKQRGVLANIDRVGGASAGAINALLLALGFTMAQQRRILYKLDFTNFLDDSWGVIRDANRVLDDYGLYKGNFFHKWVGKKVKQKLGSADATFRDLQEHGGADLYVYGTNLSTKFGEVFSVEHTPDMRLADAVRISMSIPLFFRAVRNARDDVYVDGGVLNNYPVKLFDRMKYVSDSANPDLHSEPKYYKTENKRFLAKQPTRSPYVFNKETLGFRLDSKQEIGVFRYGAEPQHAKIDDFLDYAKQLVGTIMDIQLNTHLHSDDWNRTVYIDTLGVGTTDFDLSDKRKERLEASGKKGTEKYFDWYDAQA